MLSDIRSYSSLMLISLILIFQIQFLPGLLRQFPLPCFLKIIILAAVGIHQGRKHVKHLQYHLLHIIFPPPLPVLRLPALVIQAVQSLYHPQNPVGNDLVRLCPKLLPLG